jgi:hypothetical protein
VSKVSACGVLVFACAAGCAHQQPLLMHRVPSLSLAAPPDAALVVFARASSACDEGSPFLVADEALRFLGESAPATKFAARVAPGHRAFFTWQPFGDLPRDKYPVNQVGAVEGDFEAGRTYYVDVSIANDPYGVHRSCGRYTWLKLRLVDPAADADFAAAFADAVSWEPDTAKGQHALDVAGDDTAQHVALGMRKLRR